MFADIGMCKVRVGVIASFDPVKSTSYFPHLAYETNSIGKSRSMLEPPVLEPLLTSPAWTGSSLRLGSGSLNMDRFTSRGTALLKYSH